jgi:hypothetical protein
MKTKDAIKRLFIRKKPVSTSMDEDVLAQFRARCKRMKRPMSRVIQALVEDFLKEDANEIRGGG